MQAHQVHQHARTVLDTLVASDMSDRSGPFCRLVVFADLGQSENASSTVEHMQVSLATDPYFAAAAHLLYVSDYSYADTYQSNGTDTVR